MKKFIISLFIIFSFLSVAFAKSEEIDTSMLEPEKITEINYSETEISIKTDIPDVDIYLNRVYKGRSNLTVSDLLPGFYTLELRKIGYEDKSYLIEVKKGYELEYFVKMEKVLATISLVNIPEDVSVVSLGAFSIVWNSINGISNCDITVVSGKHEVSIKKFGYKSLLFTVDVEANKKLDIDVKLEPAEFEISDFNVDKKELNPDYRGKLGECEFYYLVTADGKVDAKILNELNQVVWNEEFSSFTTWEQSFIWNGTDNEGRKLPDGNYQVVLSDGDYFETVDVLLDREISYPILDFSKVGGGVGNLPAVFKENSDFVMLNLGGDFIFKNKDEGGVNVSVGVLYNFAKHYELGLNAGVYEGEINNNAMQVNASIKIYDDCKLGSGKFCYGGLIRYGLSSGDLYSPGLIDCGNGLGTGALFGFDFEKIYFGLSSQFVLGIPGGKVSFNDSIFSNGLSLKITPVSSIKIEAWGALNSAINGDWLRAVDTGVEFLMMPESTAFLINVKFDAKIFMEYDNYYSCGIGLSYLF